MESVKCICCGAVIPEGQLTCPNCLVASSGEGGEE
jgi:RNA polymerase subunit RPABC4/transcription elongation factor Spt4